MAFIFVVCRSEAAKLNDVELLAYLTDVLAKIVNGLSQSDVHTSPSIVTTYDDLLRCLPDT